jgi:hypothetical protein
MASSDPAGDGFKLLYGVLSADSTLMGYLSGGLWEVYAPPGTTTPYALLACQSATDVNGATASRMLTTLVYQVKIVGPAQVESTLRTAYIRADGLLQPSGRALSNTNGTLACFRQQTFSLGELVNGALWLNVGGFYRVEV